MNAIEGYVSHTSVFPGETIAFHVRTEFPYFYFQIDIYRKGKEERHLHSGRGNATSYRTAPAAYASGSGWPSGYSLTIPHDWKSGIYIARLTAGLTSAMTYNSRTDILFVVKAVAPDATSKILFQHAATTYQAYNDWGGKNLCRLDSTGEKESDRVSFNRPSARNTSVGRFYKSEFPLISWLENKGYEVGYCTGIDLHADPDLLKGYRLLLNMGEDEYWSKEMSDHVGSFIADGGNIGFFSKNICWHRIRFEDDNRTMVYCRETTQDAMTGTDDTRVTVL